MMVDFSLTIIFLGVHPCVKQHLHEGDGLGEDQPDIHHLHIGGGGKGARDTDKESCQHQEGSQVNSHDSFKEKIFKKVCCVDNAEEQEGW